MIFKNIGSGSKGNCSLVKTDNAFIMFDCGINFKTITNYEQLDNLDAIFITHEHTDHAKYIGSILNNTKATLYISELSFNGMYDNIKQGINKERVIYIKHNEEITIGDVKIKVIPVSHDSKDAINFVIKNNNKTLSYLTDLGYSIEEVKDIHNSDMYYIESNHDVTMLMNTSRPQFLKSRILSDKGHLSNIDCSCLLANTCGDNTKYVMFSHLSEEANTEELAIETIYEVFESYNKDITFDITCARQHEPSKWFEI